jgi:hypothetical protein
MGGLATAVVFMGPIELEIARFLGTPRFAEGLLSAVRNRWPEASPPRRSGPKNVNNAAALTLSQNAKSGRLCNNSRTKGPLPPQTSAMPRRTLLDLFCHLAADFAPFVGHGMNVEIPLACHQIGRLSIG